jgi:hypothetical protein
MVGYGKLLRTPPPFDKGAVLLRCTLRRLDNGAVLPAIAHPTVRAGLRRETYP